MRWPKRSWRGVAAAECVVGLVAIPILFSPRWAAALFIHAAAVPIVKILLPIILVAPPAIAMGLVLPWLLGALKQQEEQATGFASWLYASNTFGGIAGIGVVLLSPLPSVGIIHFGLLICGMNFVVALAALILAQMPAKPLSEKHAGPGNNLSKVFSRRDAAFAFLSGFLVLSLEVILQHQFAQVTINSQFSGGTVLALVLIGLGIGAVIIPMLIRISGRTGALQIALLATCICTAAQPFAFTWMRGGVSILPYELPVVPYTIQIFKLGAMTAVPVFVTAGLIFPLLLRNSPQEAGRLLAWNGLGGWLGTEITQGILAPLGGLWLSVEILAAAYFIGWLWLKGGIIVKKPLALGAAGVLVACWVATALAATHLPQATTLPGEHLAAVKVGREGVVATVECAPDDWRILFNNSYTLGGSKARFNQERQGLLPLLLHGHPESVATLGIATGGTVAGVSLYPGIKHIDAIELSPLVLKQARQFFSPFDRDIFRDPRISFIVQDARWVMMRKQNQYDVVVGDLFLPWRTGQGRLFTLEHFQNVRGALKPGGIYCQWLPMFQLTRAQFETIARTFQKVFPDAFLVRGDFYFELPIIGLVGGRSLSEIDWHQVETGCAKIRDAGIVTDPLVRHPEGVAMTVLGPLPDPGPGPINTLANSWLEWDAGRNIIGMKTPWFLGVPYAEYVRQVQRAGNSFLPDTLRANQDTGQFFLTLEVAAACNLPAKANLEEQIPSRLPKSLIEDSAADWRQWPSRVKFSFAPIHKIDASPQ